MTAKEARHLAENANQIKEKIREVEVLINENSLKGLVELTMTEGLPTVITDYFVSEGYIVEIYTCGPNDRIFKTKIKW